MGDYVGERAALRLVRARVLYQMRAPYRPITSLPLPPIAGPQNCRPRCCTTGRGIVGNVTPHDKIQTDHPSGVILANCWNSFNSEAVAEKRCGEVERSNAVNDSDADWPQMLFQLPTPCSGYYEPGTAAGGNFERATGQPLTRLLLIPTSPADHYSSGGRRSLMPPRIPLAKLPAATALLTCKPL